jgi:nitrate/TMAO reductase-like tetraheme cytochrome c subunit
MDCGASPLAFDLLRSTMAALPDRERGKALYVEHCERCHSSDTMEKQSATAPSVAAPRR